jgi:Raf kinase inhibitor-like YbhB/YbcL family protein
MTLSLTSPAFPPNGDIPKEYTCDGKDLVPPLEWSGAPADTNSFALIVDDPDAPDPKAPKTTWVHWVLDDIPVAVTALPKNATAKAPSGRDARGRERLETHRVRRPLPAHRPAPLLPQAVRAGRPLG